MNGNGRSRLGSLHMAWRLARPYWTSSEGRIAWVLLLAVVALNLANVYISVRINTWSADFYNALQNLDSGAFFHQLIIFCVLAAAAIVFSVYAYYLQQVLQIRWRRFLTNHYLTRYLADQIYFRLQLDRTATDNPDQRIQDDLDKFTEYVLRLFTGLLSAVVSVLSFTVILAELSGPADIPLGSWGSVHIPIYLVWAALIYAGLGTWLTIKIGRPLVMLNFIKQRYEADFRYSLVRVRENAESIAFYGGEPAERITLDRRFARVFENFYQIMRRTKQINWFTNIYAQIAIVFPIVVVAPRYLAQQIQLGGLMQVVNAFGNVQSSLSFIITSYVDIATWSSVTRRLETFEEHMDAIDAGLLAPPSIEVKREGEGVSVKDLDIDLPDGTPLLRGIGLDVKPGQALLVTGPSGSGKSTMLRAVAGIWPFGKGSVRLGEGRVFFLPQRPYVPLGSLREALSYPAPPPTSDAELGVLLEKVGLGHLAGNLDSDQNWPLRLSLGEQQRLAFARVMLAKPDLLFLDEATSAVDETIQGELYALVRNAGTTLISIGHRASLEALHDAKLDLGQYRAPPPEKGAGKEA